MLKKIVILFFIPLYSLALNVNEIELSEYLHEKAQGNIFLQLIWDTDLIVKDVETQNYINKLGQKLVSNSEGANKHFYFFLFYNDNINAFAGPYGYIGIYQGLFLNSNSEAELAGVLAHEIAHVNKNHLSRFNKKSNEQFYLAITGILASLLVDNVNASQAILASTIAGITQQSFKFSQDNEREADRLSIEILVKSGFNPQAMAYFLDKTQNSSDAEEFLTSHPSNIERIADIFQRTSRYANQNKEDSFEYLTVKAKSYYHNNNYTETEISEALKHYMNAYDKFEQQQYKVAQEHIEKLLKLNTYNASKILAGRIASKLGNIKAVKKYFYNDNNIIDQEANAYYMAKYYLENQQEKLGIAILKPFLKINSGSVESYELLSLLYTNIGDFDQAHTYNAERLILQGKLTEAILQYKHAKSITNNKDLYDISKVKIDELEQLIDLYESISS